MQWSIAGSLSQFAIALKILTYCSAILHVTPDHVPEPPSQRALSEPDGTAAETNVTGQSDVLALDGPAPRLG